MYIIIYTINLEPVCRNVYIQKEPALKNHVPA